jgi:hypothetical protein
MKREYALWTWRPFDMRGGIYRRLEFQGLSCCADAILHLNSSKAAAIPLYQYAKHVRIRDGS